MADNYKKKGYKSGPNGVLTDIIIIRIGLWTLQSNSTVCSDPLESFRKLMVAGSQNYVAGAR